MTPIVLGVLAVLLAGPVPAVVARWGFLRRTPIATMVLWQCLALSAVLAALGTSLSLATGNRQWWVVVPSLVLTGVVLARLAISGHRIGIALRRRRREHRGTVDLLAADDGGVRFVDADRPLAYCVPALRHSRVVVSTAARSRLSERQLDAVLAHERAHLRARHDLVLEAFSVLHAAFPRWVSSAAALRQVRTLVEILADRRAAHQVGARPLAGALVELAGAGAPVAALAAGSSGSELLERVELLGDRDRHAAQSALVLIAAAGLLVLPTALVALPWLIELAGRL